MSNTVDLIDGHEIYRRLIADYLRLLKEDKKGRKGQVLPSVPDITRVKKYL
jgi:hypothetical protein